MAAAAAAVKATATADAFVSSQISLQVLKRLLSLLVLDRGFRGGRTFCAFFNQNNCPSGTTCNLFFFGLFGSCQ